MNKKPFAKARWIGEFNRKTGMKYTPVFRHVLELDAVPEHSACALAGVGFYELYVNGQRVGVDVLEPQITRYQKRALYRIYELAPLLRRGFNVLEVVLGNGAFNTLCRDSWNTQYAEWRSDPRFILQLENDGKTVLTSDLSWKVAHGPTVFNSLRNGEHYDARLELAPWRADVPVDPKLWHPVVLVAEPGGELAENRSVPCRVVRVLAPVASWAAADGAMVFDFGENITGHAQITVAGPAGDTLTMRYGELLSADRELDQGNINWYVHEGEFQTDKYTLKGGAVESWGARFVYHGFRYVRVEAPATVKLEKIVAAVVHTAFESRGEFRCDNADLNRLVECAKRSYLGNFVGIPTDCPHREKLGWSGDAMLAAELGLWHYDAAESYREYLRGMRDCQRDSGQVPGVVPNGCHWEFGPVWDGAMIMIPYYIYLHTGDLGPAAELYGAMKKLMKYFRSLSCRDLMDFGPGDWCHPDTERRRVIAPVLDASAVYLCCARAMSCFADKLGKEGDFEYFSRLAGRIRHAYNRDLYHGDGLYGRGEITALGLALALDIVPESERAVTARRLNETVAKLDYKAEFGIVGAKYVPRALAANGYMESALRLFTQPEQPGWGWWLKQGATTLWETWAGTQSQNHVMFGDVGAWVCEFLGGIRPDIQAPGFRHFTVTVQPTAAVGAVDCRVRTVAGTIVSRWRQEKGRLELELTVPPGSEATVRLPGDDGVGGRRVGAGTWNFRTP